MNKFNTKKFLLFTVISILNLTHNCLANNAKKIKSNNEEKEFLSKPEAKDIKTTEEITAASKVKPEKKMNDINQQLIDATIARDSKLVKEMLQKGASANAAPNQGITALHLASTNGDIDIIKLLISFGANVNIKDNQGYTPLDYAFSSRKEKAQKLLQAHGAKISTELIKQEISKAQN